MAVATPTRKYQSVTGKEYSEEDYVKMIGKAKKSADDICKTYEQFGVFPSVNFYLSRFQKTSELLGKCQKSANNGHREEIIQCLPYETLEQLYKNAETAKSGKIDMVFYNLEMANGNTQIPSKTTWAFTEAGGTCDRILTQKPKLAKYLD